MLPAHQPSILIACVLLSRTWLLFILAASSRQHGAELLDIFYPDKYWFYLGLAFGLIPLSRLLLPQLWQKISLFWQSGVFLTLLASDYAYHLYVLSQQYWQFHWARAAYLWLASLLLYLLTKALINEALAKTKY